MKNFLKNYKSSLILLGAILIGGIVGVVLGPKATMLKPFGDLFLNLLFMSLVPLVFFSVSSAIANMNTMKRLGKIMGNIVIVFLSTAFIAAVIGILGAIILNPTKGLDSSMFTSIIGSGEIVEAEKVSFLDQIVKTVTVNDFNMLFSKSNMLQLIVFAVLFGLATAMAGEKAKGIAKFVEEGSEVIGNIIKIIMYYAPIGLGCYFASVIGELGTQILSGYVTAFLLYLGITVIYYFGFYTIYAYLAGGKEGIKIFWKNAVGPTVTAVATCSSAACIPVNLVSAKNMGVPDDIAETVVPLGANIHKDGSVIGGVLKITFLMGIFGMDITNPSTLLSILVVSFLVGAVVGAIPGGGVIGEMLILSVFGFSPEMLPIITVLGTVIDAPATLLNSAGNTVCAMMVARLVEGKNWLISKSN
ncbi:dicarboxylate symporter family protein [[Clostridium] bifermentans ATCC 638]|jgi:Na+/H+-dicarboxylate symporter|uniref:Dicarboxylate symporter family protein n=1 Tax=Paraclostridium bifermentans ATCC 638 = DSM 14991 TaxID=1233171 RepID=T4VP62_PARBF|nr:dicarboxylate/amino acid:cation symporter [Paraclostridium bifermentans]EQK43298.1 dicarboxylate symporter family protein [[Clostridium] bifermentans ATCC 638] [Paraclostridium bifermentans ATCC 638 = DSM 14991]MDU3336262.1 dicarboxylate/amino acid:cation symporter [Paraclostridium bifermentans]RIZ60514.1 dicarboxylate/amino acid:cation symporter [Paraclostridium bifermentans]UAG17157.1 dicarboxylate/amino acid:cation symporter [Paraclostridium bifermentans]